MSRVQTNIKIISPDGGDFAYFTDKKDLYSKLSGVKDEYGENMEFIEIGQHIQLNEHTLKVIDINLKFENIDIKTKHIEKTEESMPENLIIEVVITVENVPLSI
ncbi:MULTISPECIES: hypothetical protein [Flavobacteriaceae]|uniref:hypothetical protein n=1 Tax=Flavobacteriaceae TaxID=49546 RepID=UPI0014922315|nr:MULTISPECIES: hypothetical protein [Allomuricauda]MDC6367222.1 hypothetical protein [Muricauda sp. AC10]